MPNFENFPDDDELALLLYIEEFTEQYEAEVAKIGEQEDTRGAGIDFMNNVLAAARALDVEGFHSWEVPEWDNAYEQINKFRLFAKAYVIRSEVKRARSGKAFSVVLDPDTKQKIHTYISQIRDLIEKADLEERKRNSLFAKLSIFEADVDRNRTRFDNAMAFIIDAANTAQIVGEKLGPLSTLIKRINELLGRAKEEEGDTRLPPPVERKRIEGPKEKAKKPDFSRQMDEDIPF